MSASDSKMIALVTRLVETSRRHAPALAITIIGVVALLGALAMRHIGIDTDTEKLFSPTLAWRRAAAELDRAFPQNTGLLAVVVDAATPDQAEDATEAMRRQLAAEPQLFQDVREPDGGVFFRTNGLLFLARDQVQKTADEMIAAQPMLGTLAADPNARGVFDALDLLAQGPLRGDIAAAQLSRPFQAITQAIDAAVDGRYQPLSWQNLLSNRKPEPGELRRFLLARPALAKP